MSTHCSPCTICGKQTACCSDEHVLGIEIYGHQGCENSVIPIGEFCSVECFIDIRKQWDARFEVVMQHANDYPNIYQQLQELMPKVKP